MATENQIGWIEQILRLAMQISLQGKYHVFARYSGHVNVLDVCVNHADSDYQNFENRYVDGLASNENWIQLSSESGELLALLKKLEPLLARDDDGIPV